MRFWQIIVGLWLILVGSVTPISAQTNGPARLSLQNRPLQDEKILIVDVVVSEVTDLFAAELRLRYDPTQLQVRDDNARLEGVQIKPGLLLAPNQRFIIANTADATTGQILFAFTGLASPLPVEGEGVLATIIFDVAGSGPFSIEIEQAELVSSEVESVAVETVGLTLDSDLQPLETIPRPPVVATSSSVASAAETRPEGVGRGLWSWGIVIGAIGLILLGSGLVWWQLGRRSLSSRSATATKSRSIPGRSRSPKRTAALLTEQGNSALNQGDVQKAYDLFSQAIELDPVNVEAWLGKGLVAEQETEKRICFQRVLALDPTNDTAQTGLQQLGDHS